MPLELTQLLTVIGGKIGREVGRIEDAAHGKRVRAAIRVRYTEWSGTQLKDWGPDRNDNGWSEPKFLHAGK